jgi:hypothetical protein
VVDITAGALTVRFSYRNHVGWAASFDPQELPLMDSSFALLCYSALLQ